jgi:hypothetical protein
MANTAGLCTSFLKELLQGVHALCQDGTTGSPTNITPARSAGASDTIKAALYLASGSLSPATTTTYGTTSEVSGTGYTAGGAAVTVNPGSAVESSRSGCVTPSNIVWAGLTLSTAFDTVLLYNSSQGNRAISLHNFGSQTITAGTLTLTMPANAAGTALIELAGQ